LILFLFKRRKKERKMIQFSLPTNVLQAHKAESRAYQRKYFSAEDRVTGTHRKDPILPQNLVLGNFSQPAEDWEKRKMTPVELMVYPLGRKQDTAAIKGELCMSFKALFVSGAGWLPSPEVTVCGNGLTMEQLKGLTFAGQVLWPGESSGTGDNTCSVVTCGPITIVNTGADTIMAGSGIIIDDPEVVEEGGMLHPRFVDPGVESEKFLFTTRPFRMGSHLGVFQRLTKKIIHRFKSLAAVAAPTYEGLREQTKTLWKEGSICLSDIAQPRCPLRRFWMYLCDLLTTPDGKLKKRDEYGYKVDEDIVLDFNRAFNGVRIPGTLTGVAATLPAGPAETFIASELMQDVDKYCFGMQMLAEYMDLLRRRFVGVAISDMRRGEVGHCLLSYKNF